MKISLAEITQNPNQVRKIAKNDELTELASSIEEHGLLQPIKVRPKNGKYELVYGHRRLAAMRLLGWEECEAIVEGVSDDESLIQSIAENLQRQNLDVLDEARSYQIFRDRGYTIKEIADFVKKPQGRISNRLSILRLPEEVQELVKSKNSQHATTTELGALSADSASRISSATVSDTEAIAVAKKAIEENLTSRDVRDFTSQLKETEDPKSRQILIAEEWQSTAKANGQTDSYQRNGTERGDKTPTVAELMHRKLVWNLRRINLLDFDHFTIGYSLRSINQFLELLHLAKVDLLADVRRNPISRYRPEFSKSNLQVAVADGHISYAHWPELGIPSKERQNFDRGDLFDWYEENIKPESHLLKRLEQATGQRIAFMCVELDPDSCHRHRISMSLEQAGFRLLDL